MKSVRLGRDREQRLSAAALAEGVTESEYLRRALDRALEEGPRPGSLRERLSDVIGSLHAGGGVARRTSEAFGELLELEHREQNLGR